MNPIVTKMKEDSVNEMNVIVLATRNFRPSTTKSATKGEDARGENEGEEEEEKIRCDA